MPRSRVDIANLVRRSQAAAGFGAPSGDGALQEVTGFGSNPGQLRMLAFLPPDLPPVAPLVVALHGCSQTAGGYDRGTGWSTLAARQGFALLLPEQRQSNNPNRCFNWFEPEHTRRDGGEALSIRQMVAHLTETHRLDPQRVFVTGLSAGGAMASVMLATYPEVFAAGAILAGLPHGAAHSVSEAFEAMATGRPRPALERGEAVRRASPHPGPWPRVSVWQGDADITVRPANAEEILKQWRDLHGLTGAAMPGEAQSPAHRHQIWPGPDGVPLLEHHAIAGMAHGVPIAPGSGASPIGEAAPWILDVGLPSTEMIAGFFGLGAAGRPSATAWLDRVVAVGRDGTARLGGFASAAPATAGSRRGPSSDPLPSRPNRPERGAGRHRGPEQKPEPGEASGRFDPGRVIRRALKAAGLLR